MAEEINLEQLAQQVKITIEALKKVTPGSVRQRELQQLYEKQIQSLRTLQKNTASGTLEFQKINRTLAETQDAFGDYQKELDKSVKAEQKRQQELKETRDKYKKSLNDIFGNIASLGDASTTGSERVSYFTKALSNTPLKPFDDLTKSLDYNIDNYRLLASYGADFGKSLLGLREAARQAQLPIEEFRNALGRNTENLAALFGTVNQGTRGFGDMTNVIRRDARDSLYALGLTTEDLLEYQNTYLSRQRIQGRRDFLNNEMVSQQVTAYAKSLNELSRLTGIQNTELDKQVKEQQADGVFQAYLSSLDEQTAMKTQNLIATLSAVNPALGTTAKNLLATGVPLDDLGQELTALAPGFQDAILAFKQSGDVAGTLQNLRVSAQGFQSRFQGTSGAATLLAGGLSDASNSVLKLASMSLDLAAAQEQQRKAADPLTKELAVFQDSARRLKAAFESIQTDVLSNFARGLGLSLGATGDGMLKMSKAMTTYIQENPGKIAVAYTAATALKYGTNLAKEIGIVAAGVRMGFSPYANLMRSSGSGFMGMGGKAGRYARIGGTALAGVGAAVTGFNDVRNIASDDEESKKQGWAGLIGGALGATLGAFVGGPAGAMIGYSLGSMAGSGVSSLMDSKAMGGGLNINTPTLVGERGPELILPKTSGQVVPLMSSGNKDASVSSVASAMTGTSVDLSGLQSTMNSVRDVLTKSENHLNKLVSVGLTQVQKTEDVKSALGKQGSLAYVG